MINKQRLNDEYFEWMYDLVFNNEYCKSLFYKKLLHKLNDTEFYWIIENDQNRASDGIELRYRFGSECGYSEYEIEEMLDTRECSVLEMMVALSCKIEEQVMDDENYGDRTSQWFWSMIISLGLGRMNDIHYEEESKHIDDILDTFMNRGYKRNGEGGLFTLFNSKKNLRKVEIWYQAMWYLDENFDFSI